MSELSGVPIKIIPQDVMLARLEQSDQMREFFIQMWLQNPALAKHVDAKIKMILSPLPPNTK